MEPEDARLAIERHATSKIAHAGRSRRDQHARVPRRGAAEHRVGLALHAAHPARGQRERHRNPGQCRHGHRVDARSRRARRHVHRGRRPVLQPAGAAQVPEVRHGGDHADLAARDADGARLSGGRVHRHQRRPHAAGVSAGGGPARALLPAVRRPAGPHRGPQGRRRAADRRLRRRARRPGSAAAPQNVFVNRRIVKDRTIAHAIIEAYSVATIKERSPEVHLFLQIAPDRVDVNVHPTKAEVRFLEQSLVHEVLRRALGEALGAGQRAGAAAVARRRLGPRAAADAIPGVLAGAQVGNRWAGVNSALPGRQLPINS